MNEVPSFDEMMQPTLDALRDLGATQEAAFERGAAPITLIDGDKLLDLLIEHQIGVSKKTLEYFEFDPARLTQFETDGGEG